MLTWPDRPTCHDHDGHAAQFGQPSWRPPRPRRGREDPYAATYRTCSYCGSINPEDLIAAASQHALTLEMADWKYGWPHKYYVNGVPNPAAGQEYHSYTYGQREHLARYAAPGFEAEPYDNGIGRQGWRVVSRVDAAPATMTAKWYNAHLCDLDGDAFTTVADLIAALGGVRFDLDGSRLRYHVLAG
ncbi:hypothetical protein AB0I81_22870 [Nonomuraea sp. NPDC050404]|uniref:hypothetical protein n=1 Tax=Nonomuraea sp. NPDC050404 TaxID=3155783 RepID=UPI0033D80649